MTPTKTEVSPELTKLPLVPLPLPLSLPRFHCRVCDVSFDNNWAAGSHVDHFHEFDSDADYNRLVDEFMDQLFGPVPESLNLQK